MKLFALLLALLGLSVSATGKNDGRPVSEAETKAVIRAVEDEVYDYGLHGEFYQMGDNLGTPQHWKSRMHVYVKPNYDQKEGTGEIIYKLMPYGEVLRIFHLNENGTAKLDGNPQNRFPVTQPSHQTVFMDDEEVCQMKQAWRKRFFTIDTSPTPEMIEEAARRQKQRTGFSDWQFRHSGKDTK